MNPIQELIDSLKALLNGKQTPPAPPPPPTPTIRPPVPAPFIMPEPVRLEAEKAIHTLTLVDRAYHLGIWSSPEEKAKWLNDIGVFLAFDNLHSISLELLGEDKTVVAEVKINFGQHANAQGGGLASGTEVPVLDKKLVTGHRVLVQHKNGNAAQYQHLLKFNWSPAETLRRRQGDEFANSQARKTGGRQTGSIFASKDSRHTLVVTRPIGSKGFGFADCPDLGLTGVLLHVRHLRGATALRLGQRLTAQIVQLPQGIQAREVHTV
jgi:cold shock CspA family protein